MEKILVFFIKAYQYCLSPYFGSACRFYPSCSQYAVLAIHEWGSGKGMLLALRRILRCHPFHAGGQDEVPLNSAKTYVKTLGKI